MFKMPVGLYEKALPSSLSWEERLAAAGQAGYDFVEISIDESDERLARLDWPASERAELRRSIANTGVRIMTMCLSGHRKYPLGSHNPELRRQVDALLSEKAVAAKLQAIGLSSERAQARLSQLSDRQLSELAAQAALIQAGGTIQSGNVEPLGPLNYLFNQARMFFTNVYRLLFTWQDLK